MSAVVRGAIVDERLVGLADRANREHDACVAAATAALGHAIAAGEFLIQARELVPRGEWEPWVFANFRAPTMSRPYMRLARYKHLLPADVEFSQIEALRYLRGLPGTHGGRPQHQIDNLRDEGMRLLQAGFSQRETASILGISKNTIQRWRGLGGSNSGAKREALLEERRRVRKGKQRHRRRLAEIGVDRSPGSEGLVEAHDHLLQASEALRDLVRRVDHPEARSALVDALTRLALVDDNLETAARLIVPRSERCAA